jgi:lysophospholipase L1-like esterase
MIGNESNIGFGKIGKRLISYVAYCQLSIVNLSTLCLFLLIAEFTCAQQASFLIAKTDSLTNEAENVIQNASSLDDFFESLYQLQLRNDRKLNIVHIGDSHIQADYLTSIVRRNLQKHFGNAGRGLIVPAKVAGTNGPFNVITRSSVKWNTKRIVQTENLLPIGIGGITIQTDQPNAQLEVLMNDLWLDYSFNAVTLFFQRDVNSFFFSVKDTTGNELGYMGAFMSDPSVNYSRVVLPKPIGAMTIETVKASTDQRLATIFGINLENEKNGILYHAIGVNGARYSHYNAAAFFARQTAALTPDIFIISLGTNEAIYYPNIDKNFLVEVDKLVTTLRLNNPQAKFILTTPPDAFRKKAKHNPGVSMIREQIIQYAVDNGLAFYDLYKAMGGDHAADAWRKSGLLRSDGIHFTKAGYEYQGNLLFNAIMKSYNQYVPFRHP